jgi:hypothetical protein
MNEIQDFSRSILRSGLPFGTCPSNFALTLEVMATKGIGEITGQNVN